jgi:hypothetical protein
MPGRANPISTKAALRLGLDPLDAAEEHRADLRARLRRFADGLRQTAARPAEDLQLFLAAGDEDAMLHVRHASRNRSASRQCR